MIIWLASYPKSGNTWLRAFISAILFSKNGEMNEDLWKKIKIFPRWEDFDDLINDKEIFKLNKREDITKFFGNFVHAQDKINLDNKIKFLKTHFLNCKIDNFPFTDQKNTLGVIHIVRDPRNVVTSLQKFFNLNSIDSSYRFLINNQKWIGIAQKKIQAPQFISSWDNHYNTWKQSKKNYLLIKYEDLITKPFEEFNKIKEYIEKIMSINIEKEKFINAINSTSFNSLRALEKNNKFDENNIDKDGKKIKFFNLGKENDWRKIIDKTISDKIEEKFYREMKELNYI